MLYRILINLKLFFAFMKLLPSKDFLYKMTYKNSNHYSEVLKKFDYIICDARLSDLYNKNKRIIYEAINHDNVKLIAWFYSWDNVFFNSVIKRADYVLTWSKYFHDVICKIHNYKKNQIIPVGPLQLDYLRYSKFKNKSSNKKQILFACTYGKDGNKTGDNFYLEEKLFINKLSEYMLKIDKKVKIIVRLYPSSDVKDFADLKKLRNVYLYDYGKIVERRSRNSEKIRFERNFNKKIKQIRDSTLIMSYGSTFNIEAAYLNKLVFHIDFDSKNYINTNFANFRLKMEYLNFLKFNKKNIINNEIYLKKVLTDIFIEKKVKDYKSYSIKLRNIFCNKLNKSLTIENISNSLLEL